MGTDLHRQPARLLKWRRGFIWRPLMQAQQSFEEHTAPRPKPLSSCIWRMSLRIFVESSAPTSSVYCHKPAVIGVQKRLKGSGDM
jgi:hypothetical protein